MKNTILCLLVAVVAGCSSQSQNNNAANFSNRPSGTGILGPMDDKFDTVKEPPLTADTRFAAGQLAEAQERFDAAIDQYQAAIQLNPKHHDASYRLAIVHTRLRQFPQAIDAWKKYVVLTNQSAGAITNLALCYEMAGKLPEAESAFLQAITREPKNERARVNFGMMLTRQSRLDEAMQQFTVVLTPSKAYYNVASVLEQQGNRLQARMYYRQALESDPNMLDAQQRLAGLDRN